MQSFASGMTEEFSDFFIQPYIGKNKEGMLGAMKGVGKGLVSLPNRVKQI